MTAVPVTLADFDPFGAHAPDLYDHLQRARQEQSVFHSATLGAWCVTRHADLRAIATDPDTYSSHDVFPRPVGLPPAAQEVMDFYYGNRTVTMTDPPGHGPIRRSLHTAFGPRAIAGYEPAVAATIAAQVAAIPDTDPFDLVAGFSTRFPLAVVMQVIGMPAHDVEDLRRWVEGLVGLGLGHAFMTPDQQQALGTDLLGAVAYFRDLVDRRTAEPGTDLVSYMIHNEVGGRTLSRDEVANNAFNLLAAGNETTGSALTNIVAALTAEPDRWSALARGELDVAAVVAEGLRLDAPLVGAFRTTTRPVTIGGVEIAAGKRVLLLWASGNHDEALVEAPGEFRLDRRGQPSLSFGHGVHNCVGAPLARRQLEIALRVLADRFPVLHRADVPAPYKPLAQVRSPAELWLGTSG